MRRLSSIVCFILLSITLPVFAAGRSVPEIPVVHETDVRFDGDCIKAYYVLLDTRSPEEKEKNNREKKLGGPVIIFIQGHSENPDQAYELSGEIAMKSKSGIVMVLLCNVQYGEHSEWRGDRGKDVVHMEVIRRVMNDNNIYLDGYRPLTDMKVSVGDREMTEQVRTLQMLPTKLVVIGWSHGALLARRFVSAYPDVTIALGQMAPAGFNDWGWDKTCTGPACVNGRFVVEGCLLNVGHFRGESKQIFSTTWDTEKWFCGESCSGVASCINGNFHILKPFRAYKDIQEAAVYLTDETAPTSHLKSIVVIFARQDSLFRYDSHAGISDPDNPGIKEVDEFWQKFYPGAVKNGAKLTFKVLPGNHIGPAVHYRQYAEAILIGTDQLKTDQ